MDEQKTILIIEDHDESRYLYGEILRSEDFKVIETENGKEALAWLELNSPPDLILMDLTFPYMSAQEFHQRLMAQEKCHNTPVLIVSGQFDTQEQAQALNATDYIRKPFDLDLFVSVVKKCI